MSATGDTSWRSREKSNGAGIAGATAVYQVTDKPVPQFISHNDQICRGGGAASQRIASHRGTCWNVPSPSLLLGAAGRGRAGSERRRGMARESRPVPHQASPASFFIYRLSLSFILSTCSSFLHHKGSWLRTRGQAQETGKIATSMQIAVTTLKQLLRTRDDVMPIIRP